MWVQDVVEGPWKEPGGSERWERIANDRGVSGVTPEDARRVRALIRELREILEEDPIDSFDRSMQRHGTDEFLKALDEIELRLPDTIIGSSAIIR